MFLTGKNPNKYRVLFGIFFLLILTGIVFADDTTMDDHKNIILYGLFPTSGPLTSQGEVALAAFELGISDINTYLLSIGSDITVIPHIEKMSSETESAIEKVIKLDDGGAGAIITYLSSYQADAVADYCKSHGIMLYATGADSPLLAIPEDNLIRMNSGDLIQADVIAKLFSEKKLTRIIPIIRDDSWGGGLINAVSHSLGNNIIMDEGIRYKPDSTDYSKYVSELDHKLGEILSSVPSEEIAIYAVTGREIQAIMTEAEKDEYENLARVRWFGCNENALLPELTGTSKPAQFAGSLTLTSVTLDSEPEVRNERVFRELHLKFGKNNPDGHALATYDTTWIVFKAHAMDGFTDSTSVDFAVQKMAEQHAGISGDFKINENGDRYTGIYYIWELSKGNDGSDWNMVAYTNIRNDSKKPENIELSILNQ
ncbi:MAG: ABC transporter substrate-binding protein [Methanomicrobiales archaeon]|nr:ABC transporter substrate-binding protein [Methanomicrobiales archaeon]